MAAFQRQSPGVETAVREGAPEALAALLDADELDMAILNPLEGLGDNYHAEPLYTERYVVLLPSENPFRDRNAVALARAVGAALRRPVVVRDARDGNGRLQ